MMAIRRDDLEAASRLFAATPPERVTTHRMGDDEGGAHLGGRPRLGVPEQRMKFVRENMGHMKRRQMARILGVTPDRVSRYLKIIREGG